MPLIRNASIFLTAALTVSAAFAQTTTPPPTTRPVPAGVKTAPREVNFDSVGLGDVLDFFREASGANLVVDWKALGEAGVTKDSTVSMRLRRTTLRQGLKLALDSAAPGLLSFYVDGNVIHVTTLAIADSRMVTRVYGVEDLLLEIEDHDGPTLSLQNSNSGGSRTAGSGGSGGSSSGNQLFSGNGGTNGGTNQTQRRTLGQRADDLIATIQTTIRPDIWDVNGGKARMRYSNGKLIVTAPVSVQEEIGGR
ncbi:MAG: hypothetical protein QM754_13450 [Tepidisphaeraceae bacterium]